MKPAQTDYGSLCSEYAALDRATASSLIKVCVSEIASDHAAVQRTISGILLQGSSAAIDKLAEESVQFSLSAISEVCRSVAAVVPKRNTRAFAKLVVKLVFRANSGEETAVPALLACIYGDACLQHASVTAVVDELISTFAFSGIHQDFPLSTGVGMSDRFGVVLRLLAPYFEKLLSECWQSPLPYLLLRGMCRVANASSYTKAFCREIVSAIVDALFSGTWSHSALYTSPWSRHGEFMDYLMSELMEIAADEESVLRLTEVSLVYALETSHVHCLVNLWSIAPTRVTGAFMSLGPGNVLFILSCIQNEAALSCDMSTARECMMLITEWLSTLTEKSVITSSCLSPSSDIVAAAFQVMTVAFGTLADAGTSVNDLSRKTTEVRFLVQNKVRNIGPVQHEADGVHALARRAIACGFSRASFALSLLNCLRDRWHLVDLTKESLPKWLESEFALLSSTIIRSAEGNADRSGTSASPSFVNQKGEDGLGTWENPRESAGFVSGVLEGWTRRTVIHHCAFVCCICMCHSSALTRHTAVSVLAAIPNTRISFYYFPCILAALADERNGIVASTMICQWFGTSAMLQDKLTARPLLAATLRLMAVGAWDRPNSSITESCLCALGRAAAISPSSALPTLLSQIERISECFDSVKPSVKVAAMASAVQVILERPARGSGFIPLIQKCISSTSVHVNPEAASLGFTAMKIMAEEGVLDPVKALKHVFKAFDDVRNVPRPARKAFLGLLCSASETTNSRKGRAISTKCIAILRQVIVMSPPASGNHICSWEEVEVAAKSLSAYATIDILRLAFADQEQELEYDAEQRRLEAIEENIMEFVIDLVTVCGQASCRNFYKSECAISKLLERIAKDEWQIRQRSKFDVDRLERLRLASESLRKSRQAQRDGESGSISKVVGRNGLEFLRDDFEQALEKCPSGAIKGLSTAAGWCLNSATADRVDVASALKLSSLVSLECLCASKALAPSLPWERLVRHLLLDHSSGSIATERAIASAVQLAFALPVSSSSFAELHDEIFSRSSGLLPQNVVRAYVKGVLLSNAIFDPERRALCMENTNGAILRHCIDILVGERKAREAATRTGQVEADGRPGWVVEMVLTWGVDKLTSIHDHTSREDLEKTLVHVGRHLQDFWTIEQALTHYSEGSSDATVERSSGQRGSDTQGEKQPQAFRAVLLQVILLSSEDPETILTVLLGMVSVTRSVCAADMSLVDVNFRPSATSGEHWKCTCCCCCSVLYRAVARGLSRLPISSRRSVIMKVFDRLERRTARPESSGRKFVSITASSTTTEKEESHSATGPSLPLPSNMSTSVLPQGLDMVVVIWGLGIPALTLARRAKSRVGAVMSPCEECLSNCQVKGIRQCGDDLSDDQLLASSIVGGSVSEVRDDGRHKEIFELKQMTLALAAGPAVFGDAQDTALRTAIWSRIVGAD